jgi:hypothetical protein
VNISQIVYKDVSGTTKSEKAMKFACSDTVPCSNIILSNVDLEKTDGTVETYCNSATGFGYGIVHPSAECLNSNDDKEDTIINEEEIVEVIEPISEDIVHTEL